MTILVIGGAGFIGSHMVKRLCEEGESVIVLDNLSTGFRDAVVGGEFIFGDFGSRALLSDIFRTHDIDTVMHFASFIQVGESVTAPAKYYLNNVSNTLQLLDLMVEHDIKQFVFSSTAAVYGNTGSEPITEAHACAPINPYGRTKRMVEEALEDFNRAYGLNFFSLRYFNAAGADPMARIGERHYPETHLIPLVLQAASGRRDAITVFGRDYPTPDGTCVRDYVHVDDLCEAHLLAVRALRKGHKGGFFNLGNSRGYSVAEVIEAAQRVTGRPITVWDAERRAGDPPVLVADASAAVDALSWVATKPHLDVIVEDAWRWERKKGLKW
ncbi:UDP-glucose 4-epimerase [Rhodomicrobium vannielii ATCC 17100]|uniref:UDP-glucose 4-epimerase n=1 Tax=Rhodomicrobium vannielii (strain ATCC 17100 / DSM 162 / LMG 4299 / NCIMB 10020 / ATH 3.1.1) TaxID=648757 RepID=E3HZP5_RHOVT|nr:UDP-glucose 4-epimerase GalE [Rhodomicrobium vannielii]ADP72155.1 UDP-glucose 4-epimerase [Rhodomicrobium vannielii ATCC 17100]